mgnify:CR=1 FL=1
MIRGEVYWAELSGDAGFRPVVIVSRDETLARRQNVTVAEITRTVRRLPSEVPLSTSNGMPAACVIHTDNIHTIPLDHIRKRITSLKGEALFHLDQALRYSLGLD